MGSALTHSNIESKKNYNYTNLKKIRYENNYKIIRIINNDKTINNDKLFVSLK